MRLRTLFVLAGLAGLGAALYASGQAPRLLEQVRALVENGAKTKPEPEATALAPAVTVVRAAPSRFLATTLVTGSLVPREEILVAPEVEGLRVLEIRADEGDRVKQGDVLAVLESETLEAQVAQNQATLAQNEAAIAQARSQIVEAEARVVEADAELARAEPLKKSGYLSGSTYDQREATAKTARARLTLARDGLKVAESAKAQTEAQRRELDWRRSRTDVRSPVDGIVSRRSARIGAIAIGALPVGGGEPMFRIIAKGEIELDAEVTETRLAGIRPGQPAQVEAAGAGTVEGTVRLVSPEVDKATRLGRVRVFLGDNPALRIGAFARASIATAHATSLAVPQSAVLYTADGAEVQVVENGKVAARRVETGLTAGGLVEIRTGIADGDLVVAKAGTFLRDGDAVRPIQSEASISEAD